MKENQQKQHAVFRTDLQSSRHWNYQTEFKVSLLNMVKELKHKIEYFCIKLEKKYMLKIKYGGICLVQPTEHAISNLGVMSLSQHWAQRLL